VKIKIGRKAFDILRRDSEGGSMPRSRFDYAKAVGDGLGSAVITAPALWVARQFPEAPIAVQDKDGELHFDHPLAQLMRNPNPWYGSGALKMALALDYTIRGNSYLEIERGRGGRPERLYYQPSFQITPKGSPTELITHYDHTTDKGPRRIDREDMTQFRNGIDPNDGKQGLAPLQSLLREVFTDDEAANMTAAILRNLGVPGVVISPSDTGATLGEPARERIKKYFQRMFRGDRAGDALVVGEAVTIDTLNIDLAKLNIDKLRQIPEERVCAVMGIPAAVVGFGTGMEQTKVGATMKELRELAYENVIIPMQRVFAEELDRTLLPEFEPNPEQWSVVFDNSRVRVLQEDETRQSERVVRQWQGGLITRAEGRKSVGLETTPADEVYRQGFSDLMVPVGHVASEPTDEKHDTEWITKAIKGADDGLEQRRLLDRRFMADEKRLAAAWAADLEKEFSALGDEMADAWLTATVGLASRNGNGRKALDPSDGAIIDQIILGLTPGGLGYEEYYLEILHATHNTIETTFNLGVMLTDPMERAVIARGGTRRGLIDLTEQTRSAMYDTVAQARAEGLGRDAVARRIRDQVPAGPHYLTSKTRAEIIAQAETKYAQNVSSMEVYKASDTVTGIQIFDARRGEIHDPRCIELDGQIMSMEDAGNIEPTQHPNCSRSFAPVVSAAVPA